MTFMTHVKYEGCHLTSLTYQVEIEHPIELSCDLDNGPMGSYSIWEKMEGEERGHMA